MAIDNRLRLAEGRPLCTVIVAQPREKTRHEPAVRPARLCKWSAEALCGRPAVEDNDGWAMAPRPHILVITADELRKVALGDHGCEALRTPNLDRLTARRC